MNVTNGETKNDFVLHERLAHSEMQDIEPPLSNFASEIIPTLNPIYFFCLIHCHLCSGICSDQDPVEVQAYCIASIKVARETPAFRFYLLLYTYRFRGS